MPSAISRASLTRFSWLCCMAPGWKAVIWLSSRSVVMKACAVSSDSITRMWSAGTPVRSIHSRYGAKSLPTVAIGRPISPSSFRL